LEFRLGKNWNISENRLEGDVNMDEERKTIKFKKDHTLKVGSRELRFRRDDTIEVGEGQDISEIMAKDLIRRGITLPGIQHSPAINNRFTD
jgi:hypothetical protein